MIDQLNWKISSILLLSVDNRILNTNLLLGDVLEVQNKLHAKNEISPYSFPMLKVEYLSTDKY